MDEKWTYTNSQRNSTKYNAWCHNGLGGHRGVSSTYNQLEQFVHWPGMRRNIQEVIASCLICSTHDARMPKRPYGITLQPRLSGEIICAEFLHITPDCKGDFSNILITSDKISKYSIFYPCESESSGSTAHAIYAMDSIIWTYGRFC